jgi:putative glycerol-1-phosphate prenyltransferase
MDILKKLTKDRKEGRKAFAVLVDPDKSSPAGLKKLTASATASGVDYLFFGGSLLMNFKGEEQVGFIKDHCDIPVILFPGSSLQVHPNADAILLLSLISGRNPEMLIGKHVESAALLRSSKLEVIPTGYVLIESGRATSVTYISNTQPIPSDKPEIAVCTAMAGEMLGLRLIYLDAGSGALNPVPETVIGRVRDEIGVPLIVGGGITDAVKAKKALDAGADLIVIGNAIEKNPKLIPQIGRVMKS